MKAITIRQPWATLIMLGLKKFETRRNAMGLKAGEFVAIHAARAFGPKERNAIEQPVFRAALARFGITPEAATHQDVPRGTLIGVALVGGVYGVQGIQETLVKKGRLNELAFGDYGPGRVAIGLKKFWRSGDSYLFAKGKLSIWPVPKDVERHLLLSLQHLDDLPVDLTSDELRAEAAATAEDRRRKREEIERLLGGGGVLVRSPIERMIDKAVDHG